MTDESVNISGGDDMPAARRGRRADTGLADRRREEILDAAAPLFARDGYAGMDVQELADGLGLAKGTVYRYFPSKERLFLAAVDRGMLLMRAHVSGAYASVSDPLDRLAVAIRAYLEFFRDHPDQAELLVIERAEFRDRKKPTYLEHREATAAQWRAAFTGLVRDGRVRDVPVGRLVDLIGDLVYGAMFSNHFNGQHKPLATQARDLTELVFLGILTPAERARRCGR